MDFNANIKEDAWSNTLLFFFECAPFKETIESLLVDSYISSKILKKRFCFWNLICGKTQLSKSIFIGLIKSIVCSHKNLYCLFYLNLQNKNVIIWCTSISKRLQYLYKRCFFWMPIMLLYNKAIDAYTKVVRTICFQTAVIRKLN